MNKNNTHTTNTKFGVSTTTGSGIDGVRISVSYYPPIGRLVGLRGQLDGLTVPTHEDADRLLLEYGYIKKYCRNTCRFVMSRAARRRGVLPPAGWDGDGYRRSVRIHAERLAK